MKLLSNHNALPLPTPPRPPYHSRQSPGSAMVQGCKYSTTRLLPDKTEQCFKKHEKWIKQAIMVNKSIKEEKRRKPRFYMKLAIEAMKNSVDELNKDAPSPLVGAVIVFPDGTHETAYCGEFREGDHAEYTLLDKKFRTQDLSDCWLFATLEPCGPGARKEPKLCCADRMNWSMI